MRHSASQSLQKSMATRASSLRCLLPDAAAAARPCMTACMSCTAGAHPAIEVSPAGEKLTASEWEARKGQWLPTDTDKTFVRSLMRPVYQRGKIAAWVAPPRNGINGQPFDYDYVHLA